MWRTVRAGRRRLATGTARTGPARVGMLRTGLIAAGVLVAALGLAACGGSDTNGLEEMSPAEVGTRSVEALQSASSVHVVGTVDDPSSGTATSYDLTLAGSSAQGVVSSAGLRTEIVRIDEATYVRGDQGYYESINEADAAELLADRWVRLAPDAAAQYQYFTLEGLALSITDYVVTLEGEVRKEDAGDTPAVVAGSPEGSRLWAANTGEPYPLRLDMAGADQGRIEFSDYDADVTITAPTDVVDLAELG